MSASLKEPVHDPNKTLLRAVHSGNLDLVSAVLEAFRSKPHSMFDIDYRHEDFDATLHTCALAEAICAEYWEIARQLIAAGADINARYYRRTPWQDDPHLGGHDATETFVCWWRLPDSWLPELRDRLSPNICESSGETALSLAVLAGDRDRARLLMSLGASSHLNAHFETQTIPDRCSIFAGAVARCIEAGDRASKLYRERLQLVETLLEHPWPMTETFCLEQSDLPSGSSATVLDLVLTSRDDNLIRLFGVGNVRAGLDSVRSPLTSLAEIEARISIDGLGNYSEACAELIWLCARVLRRLPSQSGDVSKALLATLADLTLTSDIDLVEYRGHVGFVRGSTELNQFEVITLQVPISSQAPNGYGWASSIQGAISDWQRSIDSAEN